MGGGGGRGPTREDISRLEELARESLREGTKPEKRNIFISFAYEDLKEVNLLRGQAKNENNDLEFNDWSLKEPFDSKKADYIRRGIRERIKQSSVTLVYVTDNAAQSKWVNWEIQESIKLGKGVIAVYKGDSPPKKLPTSMIDNKDKIILQKWVHKDIASYIEKASKKK